MNKVKKNLILLFISLLFVFTATTYGMEVDPFTRRDVYEKTLIDFTEVLNQKTNQLLDLAASDFNKNPQPGLSVKETHRLLAFHIYKRFADRHNLDQEPEIPQSIGWHYASKNLTLSPLEDWIVNTESFRNKYIYRLKESVYTGMLPFHYSTSYVFRIKDLIIGPDKIDHFFDEGYAYWIISSYGENDQAAVDWGVATENGWYGKKIDEILSFADLQANWMGYRFYKELLRGSAPLFSIEKNGYVKRNRDFDWSRWIDWRFDELQNPCAYNEQFSEKGTKHIKKYLERNLEKHNYCITYRYAKSKGYFNKPGPRPTDVYLNDKIPTHFENIFDIHYLCE